MSNSSYGRLSFGVAFEEGFEFPWNNNKYDNDITEWWLEVTGYVQPPELTCFESINDSKKNWLNSNLIPVGLVKRCSYYESSYILATLTMAVEWNETLRLDLEQLATNIEADTKIIIDFLNKYEIKYEDNPSWILSSFYG